MSKQAICTVCGQTANLFTRTKLSDKTLLCRTCAKKIPVYIKKTLKKRYTLQDYQNLIRYLDYSREKLLPLFQETDRYYTIHLDTEHGLFYLGGRINEKTLILRLDRVTAFDLGFKYEGYHDSMVNLSVHGKVLMGVEVSDPYFYHEEILASGVKAPARKILYGTKISYDSPRGMEEFLSLFLQSCMASREAAAYETEISQYTPFSNGITTDLQQAMALFMIDRPEDITLERIKKQRNRLMKAFHPDTGTAEDTEYAQKINSAYELLSRYVS